MACAALLACAGAANAQEPEVTPSAGAKAAAQALFTEGKKLELDEKWPEACEKFAESQRLDPQMGTQGSLAGCYEKIGRTASAWINWLEVATLAARQGGDKARQREAYARDKAAAIEPTLSKLRVKVTERVPGLEIKRGGTALGDAQWDLLVPVDPQKWEITATAPGRAAWKRTITVEPDGAEVEVTIPKLAIVDTPPPKATPDARPDGTGQQIAGAVVGVLGLGGLGLGIGFGVIAMQKNDDSLAFCPADPNRCTAEGVALRSDALTAANVSTAGIVVGSAAAVAGLITILTAPSGPSEEVESPVPTGTPGPSAELMVGPLGVGVRGTW